MTDIKLTENQEALLTRIDLVGEGAWFDTVVNQAFEQEVIKTKLQAKATLNQLIKKGILAVDTTIEEGSSWVALTSLGGDVIGEMITEAGIATEEVLATIAGQDVLEDTPEDDEDLLGDILGVLQEVVDSHPATIPLEAADMLGELPPGQTVSHKENYDVNEWHDGDDTEWTETIFPDGSKTLKRRRMVSDAWRTDYWGAESAEDKMKTTTARLCKSARAYGRFTHASAE